MGINEKDFQKKVEHLKNVEIELAAHPLRKRSDYDELFMQYERKMQLKEEMNLAKQELKTIRNGQFNEELEHRRRVLRRLGYVDDHTITQKGRFTQNFPILIFIV